MSVKMTTFAYHLKGKELDMNTKKSFKTKSEELYIDYNDIKRQIKQTKEALDIVLKMRLDLENEGKGIHKDIG